MDYQLPLDYLIHDITYRQYNGKNLDGDEDWDEPVEINHVRVDLTPVYNRTGNDSNLVANGVIYVDGINSLGVPENVTEQSEITFKERKMIVTKAIPNYDPYEDKIHHWEIEVV